MFERDGEDELQNKATKEEFLLISKQNLSLEKQESIQIKLPSIELQLKEENLQQNIQDDKESENDKSEIKSQKEIQFLQNYFTGETYPIKITYTEEDPEPEENFENTIQDLQIQLDIQEDKNISEHKKVKFKLDSQ